MVEAKKILPFIGYTFVLLVVFVLCIVALLIPWYEIDSSDDLGRCTASMVQEWDRETLTSSGSNCSGFLGSRDNWRTNCEFEFCRNKAVVFVVTRGLLAYACVGTFLALLIYAIGAFAGGKAFQLHATGAAIFATGLCSLLPIALAVFLFGIGITSAVHQDQVDYYSRVQGKSDATADNTPCQLDVSCASLSGTAQVQNPCKLVPFGCFANPIGSPPVLVTYTWQTGPGFPVAVVAGILALLMVPSMPFLGLRRQKSSIFRDAGAESDSEVEAPLKDKREKRESSSESKIQIEIQVGRQGRRY